MNRKGSTGIFFKMWFFLARQEARTWVLWWFYHTQVLFYGVYHIPNLPGTAPAAFHCLIVPQNSSYLHVLASGSNTSMVFRYVVPSKPPTAISCPFTTARPTCKTAIRQQLLSWDALKRRVKMKIIIKQFNNHVWWKAVCRRGLGFFSLGHGTSKIP